MLAITPEYFTRAFSTSFTLVVVPKLSRSSKLVRYLFISSTFIFVLIILLICEELRRLCVVVTPSGEMMLDFLELALLKLELLVNFPLASNLDLLVTAAAEAVSAENPSPCNLKT